MKPTTEEEWLACIQGLNQAIAGFIGAEAREPTRRWCYAEDKDDPAKHIHVPWGEIPYGLKGAIPADVRLGIMLGETIAGFGQWLKRERGQEEDVDLLIFQALGAERKADD